MYPTQEIISKFFNIDHKHLKTNDTPCDIFDLWNKNMF